MKYIKWALACLTVLAESICVNGQTIENMDQAIAMIRETRKVYETGELSFDFYYTYANEHQPGILLDSLQCNMQVSNGNCRSLMGNTIILKNKQYNIAVFKDDKLIHVSRAMRGDSLGGSPLALITTAIRQAGVQACHITSKQGITSIHFDFSLDANYKYMEMQLDTSNWHIEKLEYVVKSTMLKDASEADGNKYEPYAQVKAIFYHYKSDHIDPAVFGEEQFFTRKADALIPAPAYEDYEVFIGTPNF